ncbi:MAG: rRNA methyltransferase, partial [Treponema sp.]|nr:rRNA methyltransferase [Treponema sp.]
MTGLFFPLPEETQKTLNSLPALIDNIFPLPGRFRGGLARDVAELSRLLTSNRGDRSVSYLGKPGLLSAYLRYFLPWNVYRLSRLFTSLPLELKPNDTVNDIGAGPLTLAASLWISRPELRKIPLEFRCLDRTLAILEAGKKLFSAIAGTGKGERDTCPWTVKTIRGELKINGNLSVEIKGKPAALSAAVNVYNELFWNFSPRDIDGLKSF